MRAKEENDQAILMAMEQAPKDMLLTPVEVISANLYKKVDAEGIDLAVQGTRWYVEVELRNVNDDTTAWALYRVWQFQQGLKAVRVELV